MPKPSILKPGMVRASVALARRRRDRGFWEWLGLAFKIVAWGWMFVIGTILSAFAVAYVVGHILIYTMGIGQPIEHSCSQDTNRFCEYVK